MNNLFSYIIGTQSIDELNNYTIPELDGNKPFIISTYSSIGSSYSNITSITNWDKFGYDVDLDDYEIKLNIKEYYESLNQQGQTWSSLNYSDKEVLSRYFLVDKPFRDEIYTDQEQDELDYYILYDLLTEDSKNRLGKYDKGVAPKSIDYKKELEYRLHPKFTFDSYGWLREAEYFQDLVVGTDSYGFHVFTYSNPVLKYEADYVIESTGYVASRTVTRSWQLASGTYSTDTKISHKIYEPLTARAEGRRRRKNLINSLLIDTVGLFIMTSNDLDNVIDAEIDAIPFMRDIDTDIDAYYEYGTKVDSQGNPCKLIQSVMSHTYSRLDNWVPGTGDTVSIRQYILNRLDP